MWCRCVVVECGERAKRVTTVMRLSRVECKVGGGAEAMRAARQGNRAQGGSGGRLETGASGETEF